MGLSSLDIEKHLVEFEILKNQLAKILQNTLYNRIFVPYTGATSNVDLGSKNFTTTGNINSSSLNTNYSIKNVFGIPWDSAAGRGSFVSGYSNGEQRLNYNGLYADDGGNTALGKINQIYTGQGDQVDCYIRTAGQGSFAFGYCESYDYDGDDSHILASGNGAFAGGIAMTEAGGSNVECIEAVGDCAFAYGRGIKSSGDYCFSFGTNFINNTSNSFAVGFNQINLIITGQGVFIPVIKSGATQAAAGAAADEIWKTNGHATLPNNVLMIGV